MDAFTTSYAMQASLSPQTIAGNFSGVVAQRRQEALTASSHGRPTSSVI